MKLKCTHMHTDFFTVPTLPSKERSRFSLWSSALQLFFSVPSVSPPSLPSDFPKSKPLKNFLMAEGCSFLFPEEDLFPWNCFITKSNGELFGMSSSFLVWQPWVSPFGGWADGEGISFSNVHSCLPSFKRGCTENFLPFPPYQYQYHCLVDQSLNSFPLLPKDLLRLGICTADSVLSLPAALLTHTAPEATPLATGCWRDKPAASPTAKWKTSLIRGNAK